MIGVVIENFLFLVFLVLCLTDIALARPHHSSESDESDESSDSSDSNESHKCKFQCSLQYKPVLRRLTKKEPCQSFFNDCAYNVQLCLAGSE